MYARRKHISAAGIWPSAVTAPSSLNTKLVGGGDGDGDDDDDAAAADDDADDDDDDGYIDDTGLIATVTDGRPSSSSSLVIKVSIKVVSLARAPFRRAIWW